jgi:hypothetical protein
MSTLTASQPSARQIADVRDRFSGVLGPVSVNP